MTPMLDTLEKLGLDRPEPVCDAGLTLRVGYHPSPFGEAILVATERGLAGLGFVDGGDRAAALADMQRRWPRAEYVEDQDATAPLARRIFRPDQWSSEQ